MPISDMRQDGNGLDTMGEIDSNGSCDSVVSFNSCFSDESLEYLSAEEKACLMYLEETIQSLDTEDDSGLSNDESLQLPERGNVANKAAHLSASITLNKLPSQDMPKSQSEGLYSSGSFEQNSEILNYMVPTPFVLANHNSKFQTRHGLAASQKNTASKVTSESAQIHQEAPRVPPEVNVVVIPPPRKTKSSKETKKEQQKNVQSENVAHRGPLSYEALVQLRKSASMRKTNASEANYSTNKDLNEKSQTISQISKPAPPPVAPKPKKKLNQEGASGTHKDSSIPYSGDKLMNPEKVRVEALCKLGLLKEDAKICKQLKQSQSQSKPANQTSSEHLAYSIPARPEEQINQSVQRCSPLHQRSVSDLFTSSSHTQHANMTAKSATLERTGMGLSESNTNAVSQSHRPRSSTIATNKDTQMDANESTPRKPFNILSSRTKVFSVPVPSIGKDRREALRKLGLLKN
ncbi:specifically androgen-regulated gene protein [Danio aesculapii]|uniref:specifically androgen-regulated gene protein n=1 Tax=Danio aesculapii TaxID=1142201 RepID=UPI0024C06B54|nr:specifically androgen-regulated gene protein [Danio aesculapii]XP_056324182.1 specifically androgen-regulated gene protein [Danio aesculapii]